MASLRAFICVELTRDIQRALVRITHRMARLEPFATQLQVRWVAPEQMHLTLCFLGEVDWNQTHQICQIARQVVRQQQPIMFSCDGLGAFPHWEQPRVLWAGVNEVEGEAKPQSAAGSDQGDGGPPRPNFPEACPQLGRIGRELVQQLLENRFFPDTKPLTPHITLGRLVGGRSQQSVPGRDVTPELGDCEFGLQNVRELKLMSSERTSAGPVYRPIGTIPLG